jgi:hypothetical protein
MIKLEPQGAGIGFFSRKPKAKERIELTRIPFSRTDYNKRAFLAEGNADESQHGFKFQQIRSRTGTEFHKSKYNNRHTATRNTSINTGTLLLVTRV